MVFCMNSIRIRLIATSPTERNKNCGTYGTKSENRIADYQDREEIYERQRRKMYDYKNQLSTIQTLIKNGHTNEVLSFTQKLTESIAVEMSAINTNHPVVNAVLNQKYRSMQEKHIAVILKVGDLQEICLEEEEIVILLSNLLDNAIRESEKVLLV